MERMKTKASEGVIDQDGNPVEVGPNDIVIDMNDPKQTGPGHWLNQLSPERVEARRMAKRLREEKRAAGKEK